MKRRLVYILIAVLLITVFASSYGHATIVLAQGPSCGSNSTVGSEGASCGFEGNSSGNSEDEGQNGGTNGNNTSGSAGNNNGNSNNNNTDGGAVSCSPGTDIVDGSIVQQFDPSNFEGSTYSFTLPGGTVVDASGVPSGMCTVSSGQVDACTGGAVGPVSYDTDDVGISLIDCPSSYSTPPNPCNEFIVGGGGVTCTSDLSFWKSSSSSGSSWQIRAHAGWPGNEIHTRPYPVTLVDWDSVLRVAGLGTSSGADRLGYAAWGGGSEGSPAPGDWRDIVLRLDIRPVADWAEVFLENIGLTRLQIGHLYTFQWNLPSHPAAGGGPLSGQVGQLEELEPDVPLYSNWSRAPYMVYCTLSYYEWESRCVNGPGDDGSTNCRRELYWKLHRS